MGSLGQLVQVHLHQGTCGFIPVTRLREWRRSCISSSSSFARDALVQCTPALLCTVVLRNAVSHVIDIILRSPFYYPYI